MKKRYIIILCSLILLLIISLFWGRNLFISGQQKAFKLYYGVHRPGQQSLAQGRTETIDINSAALNGTQKRYRIYLPKEYDDNPNKRYPVLYLLHGNPGNDMDWLVNADAQRPLDNLIAENKLVPLLVVFPDGNGPKISDSQYVNATTVDQKMEDYIAKDVVSDVDKRYRTVASRESRAIGGNSSGAFGAVNIGLKHNDEFSVILSFGGYFENWNRELDKVFGKNLQSTKENSPMVYLDKKTVSPSTYLYILDGEYDWNGIKKENKAFDSKLTQKNISHELVFTKGIHAWPTWQKALSGALLYLNSHITAK